MITSHKYGRQSHIKEGQELFQAAWDTIKRKNGLKLKEEKVKSGPWLVGRVGAKTPGLLVQSHQEMKARGPRTVVPIWEKWPLWDPSGPLGRCSDLPH